MIMLENTDDIKFMYSAYFGFGILSRYSQTQWEASSFFGTTLVLKVRVALSFTRAQQQTHTTAVLTAVFSALLNS